MTHTSYCLSIGIHISLCPVQNSREIRNVVSETVVYWTPKPDVTSCNAVPNSVNTWYEVVLFMCLEVPR